MLLLGFVGLAAAGWRFWFTHRPQPAPITRQLFPGVHYERLTRKSPRAQVIHLVRIPLARPGIRFLVTPADAVTGGEVRARTTSQFLRESGVQIAINAAAFSPWWSNTPWDYYPHVGDPVDVHGLAVSDGRRYSEPSEKHPAFGITRQNRVRFDDLKDAHNACSGKSPLLRAGKPVDWPIRVDAGDEPHPRTAVAVDREEKELLLVLVDGRQPNYSEGATRAELAEIVREAGGYHALNLDGGGSTALVIEGPDGKPAQLNTPIDNYLPGRERPVANHLGVFVPR